MATWEYNSAGDYRRQSFGQRVDYETGSESWSPVDGINPTTYWGGAGAPQQYAIEKKDNSGNWVPINPGEHNEAESYFWGGVTSPEYSQSYQAKQSGLASALDKARLLDPQAVGQASMRPDLAGLNSGGKSGAELAFYTLGDLNGSGLTLTPEQQAARASQIANSTPAAQSARSDSGGLLGGDFGKLAMLAAAIYSGGAAGGLWGGLGEGAAGGFIDAIGSGIGAGESITGALGAAGAGSGAMDLSSLMSGLGDTPDWGTMLDTGGSSVADLTGAANQYGWSDLASAGTSAGANADIGGSSWLNTLVEQAKANPLSTAFKTLQAITGQSDITKIIGALGAAGLGAYAANKQTTALEDQAKRYESYGAPYRQKLSDLYKDPTSFLTSKEVTTPVDQGTSSLMRSLSTQGNPFGSGNALQQGQSYASDQLFGKLGQEKDRLAGFGGLSSYNQAAPTAATNAIGSTSNAWNAAGAGVNNIFNPPQTAAQSMGEFMKAMKGGV